ncbi:hypothetical protein GPJ56_001791 [Histomonas meleagridis]|uniref:uncharacterized protein n=1 Tax=Histomonas meleagridis TaxID=135588 RepID=UPI0035598C50|nr:hypothetical protein GPJ56_001791 [Histomonas meleagridis]KAH0803272.1 hypothetical protein GO595_004008 [Histomonas meleagridis]
MQSQIFRRILGYAQLIPQLSALNYATAKDLIKKLYDINLGTPDATFWSLCDIIWNSDQQQESLTNWLKDQSSIFIPDCDPFLQALFKNDIDQAIESGRTISEEIPLILVSPRTFELKNKSPPDFLKYKSFKLGNDQLSGDSIWSLLLGDITPLQRYDLHWLLLFAIFTWYSSTDNLDFRSMFNRFSVLNNDSLSRQESESPIFCLLQHYSDSTISFADISSKLPPIAGLFFLSISNQFEPFPTFDYVYSLSLKLSIEQLNSCNLWQYSAFLLHTYEDISLLTQLLERFCTTFPDITEQEHFVLSFEGFPIETYYQIKAQKLYFASQVEHDYSKKMHFLAKSIDFNFMINSIENAHLLIMNEYLPLMGNYEEGEEQLFNWCNVISNISDLDNEEIKNDFQMLELYKKVSENNEISEDEMKFIGENLENGWSCFAIRRKYCHLCMKQIGAFEALVRVDAVPKDELLSL